MPVPNLSLNEGVPLSMNVHLQASEGRPSAARLVEHLRDVIGSERNDRADAQLGLTLCFVAGAVNAGGFLAVGQYTSHMSGMISAMADNLALGGIGLVLGGVGALLSFVLGAACSAALINWGRRHHARGQYAFPLLFEAMLLLGFGLIGSFREHLPFFLFAAVPLLCFIMGLQNAIITKISQSRMRTTHMTGVITDIGIELGKLFYWNRTAGLASGRVLADRAKLRLLGSLLGSFFVGGVVGALGFSHIGFVTTAPLAALLLLLAGVPMAVDFIARRRHSP
jgi:uncharacterized membrane protein YoaK (UPF0700 family)